MLFRSINSNQSQPEVCFNKFIDLIIYFPQERFSLRLRLRHCDCDCDTATATATPGLKYPKGQRKKKRAGISQTTSQISKKCEKDDFGVEKCSKKGKCPSCVCGCAETVTQKCLKRWKTSRKRRKSLEICGCVLRLRQHCDCDCDKAATATATMVRLRLKNVSNIGKPQEKGESPLKYVAMLRLRLR